VVEEAGNDLGSKLLCPDPEEDGVVVDEKAERRSLAISFCSLMFSIPALIGA